LIDCAGVSGTECCKYETWESRVVKHVTVFILKTVTCATTATFSRRAVEYMSECE